MKNASEAAQLDFRSLVWPIFIDYFLRMVVLVVSFGLISRISDAMAGIVGVTNLFLLVGFTFSECMAQGSSIVLTQYLGAKRETEVNHVYLIMVGLNLFIGLILSIIFASSSSFLLSTFGFSSDVLQGGAHYLTLVGSGFCIYALNYAFLYILNANGLTKHSMSYSLLVNGTALILYYLIAVLPTSFQINRLTLIALTNLFVRCVGMLFLLAVIRFSIPHFRLFRRIPWKSTKRYLAHFLRISLPNTMEPLSYQLFQFVLVKIISTLSVEALSIRSYILTLTTLFETGAWSISRGNQIMLGHLIGAQKMELIPKQLKKGMIASFVASLIILYLGLTFRYQLMYFFSKDAAIVDMGAELLILVALLTLIRAFTLNLHGGLKAMGDMKFGFVLMTIGMWCITIPGSYVLIHFFDVGLQGIWIMLAVDECIRIFFLFQRWRSQKWKNFSVVEEIAS